MPGCFSLSGVITQSLLIVQDFDSPKLKHKKHWNSFTTPFFKHLDDVRAELLLQGKISMDRNAAELHLKEDLRCQWCHALIKNMPNLKAHINQCKSMGQPPKAGVRQI